MVQGSGPITPSGSGSSDQTSGTTSSSSSSSSWSAPAQTIMGMEMTSTQATQFWTYLCNDVDTAIAQSLAKSRAASAKIRKSIEGQDPDSSS